MKRGLRGWGTVAVVSVAANLAFWASAVKFPSGPTGRLKQLLVANPRSGN